MKEAHYFILLISASFFVSNALAVDCSSMATYANGNTYSTGQDVKHNNKGYDCLVDGWCSIGAAYEPGVGWAWTGAWTDLGACSGGGSPSGGSSSGGSSSGGSSSGGCTGVQVWASATAYSGGAVVQHLSNKYIADWWTQGNDPSTNNGPGLPWISNGACGGGSSSSGGSSSGGSSSSSDGIGAIMSEAQFNSMFPNRNAFYTYQGLVNAANAYPAFAGTGDSLMKKRELAAALANFAHETGSFVYINEIAGGLYCSGTSTPCGVCASGKEYHGRGPIQLSWNFNYCAASQALGHGSLLWSTPELVAQDATKSWESALWYWMSQNGPGSMPAHDCIATNQGFGCTIRSINGALECDGGYPSKVQARINHFSNIKSILGATSVGADGC